MNGWTAQRGTDFAKVARIMLPRSLRLLVHFGASAACLLAAASAGAESALHLAYPQIFATVPASTYDLGGERVGGAHLLIEQLPDGGVKMTTETGFDAGPRTVLTVGLMSIDEGRGLRPIWQESRSFGPEGSPIGILRVDHQRRVASCVAGPQLDWNRARRVSLPDADRVANVPLNLLFLPLVSGEKQQVDFQFFLCGGGPRLLDFRARVASRSNGGPDSRHLVEIRYGPDFGTLGSLLLRPMLPRLSVWFDPNARQPWLAHRVPLYSRGPEVLVVRDGVAPSWLEVR